MTTKFNSTASRPMKFLPEGFDVTVILGFESKRTVSQNLANSFLKWRGEVEVVVEEMARKKY